MERSSRALKGAPTAARSRCRCLNLKPARSSTRCKPSCRASNRCSRCSSRSAAACGPSAISRPYRRTRTTCASSPECWSAPARRSAFYSGSRRSSNRRRPSARNISLFYRSALTNTHLSSAILCRNTVCVCAAVCPSATSEWLECFKGVVKKQRQGASGVELNACDDLKRRLEICTQHASSKLLHAAVMPSDRNDVVL